ncbi:MAG: 50S ribosomal protein L10 [Candidatus Hermodarchaeota archaeon]
MVVAVERESVKKKAQKVEELNDLFKGYSTIAIADLHKVRATQLQHLAKILRQDVCMLVMKNRLIARALQTSPKENLQQLSEHLVGSNVLLFTNMNPFKLAILLQKNKTKVTAKVGDIAPNDIIIPAGNTGLPPGPAISELHDIGIRTKIDLGSVWVINDTTVVKKGESVHLKAASVLSKLGVKPIEIGLTIRAAFDNGSIFTSDQLAPQIDEITKQFEAALVQAFNLAFNSAYPTSLTVKFTLQQAYLNARNLAFNSNYATPEVIREILAKAHSHMVSLASKVAEINIDAAPPETSHSVASGKD